MHQPGATLVRGHLAEAAGPRAGAAQRRVGGEDRANAKGLGSPADRRGRGAPCRTGQSPGAVSDARNQGRALLIAAHFVIQSAR